MTYEEIIAQAKVGGFVIMRARIADIDPRDRSATIALDCGIGGTSWVQSCNVIAIEPPPETAAQKIARLEARIAELETVINALPTAGI
jgi:hypothetical protein